MAPAPHEAGGYTPAKGQPGAIAVLPMGGGKHNAFSSSPPLQPNQSTNQPVLLYIE